MYLGAPKLMINARTYEAMEKGTLAGRIVLDMKSA